MSGCGDPATDGFHSRLRLTLSAAHEEADIHALVAVLSKPMPTRTRTRTGLLDPTIDSKWRNQLNPPSTLTIANIDSKTGEVTGTYESPSGTKGATYSLVGWVNSAPPSGTANNVPVIAFSVRWNGYGSIASWTGYCEDREGTPTISALWHLVRSNSQFSWDPC